MHIPTPFSMRARRGALLIISGLTALSASPALAGKTRNAFTHTPDAAIVGHNIEHLTEVTVADCAAECVDRGSCVSFDYFKATYECDLSDKRAGDVGGLKTDYPGNPFDHYSLHEASLLNFRQSQSAAIFGHNNQLLTNVSREDCAAACMNTPWCVSFDYHKFAENCDLSDARAEDVGGLKTDYSGDPYDHYALRDPSLAEFNPTYYTALSGYNVEHLSGVTPNDCADACTDISRRDWCVSFDYYRDTNECDLSAARADEVGGLYTTSSYDHYSLEVPYAPIDGDKHVLVIGIDGLRGDAIQCSGCADTPNLDLLIATGAFHDNVLAGGTHGGLVQSTVSAPGWASVLTGFWVDEHGVVNNDDGYDGNGNWTTSEDRNILQRTHLFDLIKLAYPSASTAVVADWVNLSTTNLAPNNADVLYRNAYKDSDEATDRVIGMLDWDVAPTAIFYYLHNVDIHASEYDPENGFYQAMIEYEDEQIGYVLDAISARVDDFPEEEWLIVVTSDHGGINSGHGGQTVEEQRTFVILNSAFARPDLPDYCAGPLVGSMEQVDGVAPHVADFLGITLPYELAGEVNAGCM